MSYRTKFDGSTDKTIQLGGTNSSTGKPNPTSIEGYFLGSKDTSSDYGPGKLHIFQTNEGTIGVWGKTRLNGLLSQDLKGQMVLATFTGMIAPSKKGRKPSYGYKVQHDPDNVIDTAGVDVNAAPSVEDDAEDVEAANYTEADVDGDESENTSTYTHVSKPKVTATTPSAERQARVQALLGKSK